jgi:hypothetical protein
MAITLHPLQNVNAIKGLSLLIHNGRLKNLHSEEFRNLCSMHVVGGDQIEYGIGGACNTQEKYPKFVGLQIFIPKT